MLNTIIVVMSVTWRSASNFFCFSLFFAGWFPCVPVSPFAGYFPHSFVCSQCQVSQWLSFVMVADRRICAYVALSHARDGL